MEKFENALQSAFEPVKPYLPAIARFLLVVTYYEDSLRILYLAFCRHSFLGRNGMNKSTFSLFTEVSHALF